MSDTKREQILKAITTKMKTITSMSSSVFRSRVIPFMRNQFPAYTVEFLTDSPDDSRFPQPIIDWSMVVCVRVFTKADKTNDLTPDQVADPLVQAAHQKMVSDLTLGGLSMDIQPAAVKNEIFDGDLETGIVSLNFLVKYRTINTDLT